MKADDVLQLAGVLCIAVGLYLAWHPLAPLFVGAVLILISFGFNKPKAS